MIQLILILLAIGLCVAVVQKLWEYGLQLAAILAVGTLVVVTGLPALLGIGAELVLSQIQMRRAAAVMLACGVSGFCLAAVFGLVPHIQAAHFEAFKYCLPAALFVGMLIQHKSRVNSQALSEPIALFDKKDKQFYQFYFGCFFMVVASIFIEMKYYDRVLWLTWIYIGLAILAQGWILWMTSLDRQCLQKIHAKIGSVEALNASQYLKSLKADFEVDDGDMESIYTGISVKFLNTSDIIELEIKTDKWVFKSSWYQAQTQRLDWILRQDFRHPMDDMQVMLEGMLKISARSCEAYIESHLESGEIFEFQDGKHFVHYAHVANVRRCVSCGAAFEFVEQKLSDDEWCCSEVCKKTEKECEVIRLKEPSKFLSDAATSGFVVMEGASAWRVGHKMFAAGSQGHGFAAERGNNMIDRLMGKSAKILGDDNAAHGADRAVNGQQIQSKYYKTKVDPKTGKITVNGGHRSVGAMFDGQNGNYKYFDDNNNPMPVEVPRDHYDDAVAEMTKRIKDGKVRGLENLSPEQCEAEARRLVVRGSLTYQQAVNITKFCTVESLTYDAIEGTIVGLGAGGISFALTTFVYYLNTKDLKVALRAGVIQAGKTFVKTTAIFIGVQQLHRLAGVQHLVGAFDKAMFSPSMTKFFAKGFAIYKKDAAGNMILTASKMDVARAIHGTIVSSVVVIVVSTGPDMLKLVRGRISKEQFIKNAAIVTAGVGGGVAGAVAGGFVGSVAGLPGAIVGKFVGGMVGGAVAANVTRIIADSIIEEDRIKIMTVIYVQIEFWAKTFVLTGEELENLNLNLAKVITQSLVERIHGARNRRAVANAAVKPLIISIVKQRPRFTYDMEDVIDACAELAA